MKKNKNKLFKVVSVVSAVTAVSGLLGCGSGDVKKGDLYSYKYVKDDNGYVMGADNGSTSLAD